MSTPPKGTPTLQGREEVNVISSTATSVATPGMATAANTEAVSPTSGRGPVFGPALFVNRGIPRRVPAPWLASPRPKAVSGHLGGVHAGASSRTVRG